MSFFSSWFVFLLLSWSVSSSSMAVQYNSVEVLGIDSSICLRFWFIPKGEVIIFKKLVKHQVFSPLFLMIVEYY